MNDTNLEINIAFKNRKYIATTTTFPSCKGKGETQEEALEKLSRSIASYISKVAKEAMGKLITSNSYSEVIIDTTDKEKVQKRVFNLDPSLLSLSRTMFIKSNAVDGLNQKMTDDIKQEMNSFMSRPDDAEAEVISAVPGIPIDSSATQQSRVAASDQDGFVFGFPLSFN